MSDERAMRAIALVGLAFLILLFSLLVVLALLSLLAGTERAEEQALMCYRPMPSTIATSTAAAPSRRRATSAYSGECQQARAVS